MPNSETIKRRYPRQRPRGPAKGHKKQQQEIQARELNVQSLNALMEWLQATSLALFIHNTPWVFTTIEVVHVFAISLVIGTIAIVDLRLLGLGSTKRPFAELATQVLPFTWIFFGIAAAAGSLLFISRAAAYLVSTTFQIKMAIIVLAGINMLIFELITARSVQKWNVAPKPPTAARLAGGISLTCWVLVVIFGRWTGFTVMQQ
jgi:hypothetical protein